MKNTIESLPDHLRKYVVEQNYSRYTSEDQAVWRYIMKQLKSYLKIHAHSAYLDGLEKTGITSEKIPEISEMDKKLKEFGWSAIPISGFIPPAAFMEFQSLGILPIASDIRTIDHIHYTPAPDIVHESAGHAPILIDPAFSEYLRSYASVAKKAIFSCEDLELYVAIRDLSDIKENPNSTDAEILEQEKRLQAISENMRYKSEAALLARMNWWTAEYGLIGPLSKPKIFGAGLLSSIGEARSCLKSDVEKIPLTLKCIDFAYDITEKQPQLFVAETFTTLKDVLEDLANTMAFRKGGVFGLEKAKESKTENTVQLGNGLQISGVLDSFQLNAENEPTFIKFSGPVQLCFKDSQLENHGTAYHAQGYSTPLGPIKGLSKNTDSLTAEDLESVGIKNGKEVNLEFESGITLKGTVLSSLIHDQKAILVSFENCSVKNKDEVLFDPSWGIFDMAFGESIPSVYGGPADRKAYGDTVDFEAKIIPNRQLSTEEKNLHQFYLDVRSLREDSANNDVKLNRLNQFVSDFKESYRGHWLLGIELLEIAYLVAAPENMIKNILSDLEQIKEDDPGMALYIEDGIRLANEH